MQLSQFIHVVENETLHLGVVAKNWQCSGDAIVHRPALDRLNIWHNDGNDAALGREFEWD